MLQKITSKLAVWAEQLNQLSLRERIILLVVALSILLFAYDYFALTPYMDARKQAQQKIATHISAMNEQQVKIDTLVTRMEYNPNREVEQKIDLQKKILVELNQLIDSFTEHLIEPKKMSRVLGDLLSRKSGMDVISVKSYPASPVAFKANEESEAKVLMYRHKMQFELSGSYFQVSDYLRMIENLQERLYWDKMVYQIDTYPKGTFTLNVHTLSLSKELIGVYN